MFLRPATLAICLLPASLVAQQNAQEGETGPPCPGAPYRVALAPGDFLDLDGATTHLAFGADLSVCITGASVTVTGTQPRTLDCAAIRNSADEGIGYHFTAEGIPHHLWFHIDAEAGAPTLEIGLYREGVELLWIDTAYPICAG